MCWGCGKCVEVWESMGRRGKVWGGVGDGGRCVEVCLGCGKCVRDVGRGVERVLGWGQCGGCGEVWGEMWGNLGEQGSVVSRFGTPTLL